MAERPGSGSPTIEHDGEVVEWCIGTSGFPYLARYRLVGDAVLVTAVYHQRRRPGFGLERPI